MTGVVRLLVATVIGVFGWRSPVSVAEISPRTPGWRLLEMTESDTNLLTEARAALESTTLPERFWAVGELKDDRLCLLRDDGRWLAGYFERGSFDLEFTEHDTGSAIARFVALVRGVVTSTEATAAATEERLRKDGQDRP